MTITHKACPVIIREQNLVTEILAFQHPLAGKQIVKGTVEPGESPDVAALRELSEESGIEDAKIEQFIDTIHFQSENQIWHVYMCHTQGLPETWTHIAVEGDGAHKFKFFWHRLDAEVTEDWFFTFAHILDVVRLHLKK